jgi:hypothetical protein
MKNWFYTALTPGMDVLTMAAYIFLIPALARSFANPGPWHAVLVAFAYACLIAGTRLLMLEASARKGGKPAPAFERAGCGVFFAFTYGVFATTMAITLSGLAGNDSRFSNLIQSEGVASAIAVWGATLILIALVFLYPISLIIPARSRLKPSSPILPMLHIAGVAGINLMMLVGVAFWESLMKSEPSADIGLGFRIFVFVLYYILFLMFQAPPRIMLFLLERNPYGLATFFLTLGFYVWPLTA